MEQGGFEPPLTYWLDQIYSLGVSSISPTAPKLFARGPGLLSVAELLAFLLDHELFYGGSPSHRKNFNSSLLSQALRALQIAKRTQRIFHRTILQVEHSSLLWAYRLFGRALLTAKETLSLLLDPKGSI